MSAVNQYVNKVIYGGQTLIDLTGDTVQADWLKSGKTAHDKTGAPITGTCTFDADTQDATATDVDILVTKTAYVKGTKVTGTMPNNGAQSDSISQKDGSVNISRGYHDGSGKITIAKTEQDKIIAANIKDGVEILGVTGNYTGSENIHATTVSVTPKTTAQTFTPGTAPYADYNYFSGVTVSAIPYDETDNDFGGKTVTIGAV